ncbi:class I SAM-dependent methyltransferase [Roseateles toxinivorans]|uniref:Lysine methyltransferase n=1 Tax=Roseateles toxinivorans TaxID=270368 RepID=A0A4R6QKM5_9BURK|nr:SAM-dependent methyltransferase [Roseateles toxinivorans]TDP63782.1 lysine methyltransferase [Roseateles toxinivorans]
MPASSPNPAPPGYLVKHGDIDVGGLPLHIRSLLDRQQFHDPLGVAERAGISSAAWPLFGLVWPSARVLAAEMQLRSFEGLKVLEVGCGLALASLVVQQRLGLVTASDCHPLAGDFLARNAVLNNLPVLNYLDGNWRRHNPLLGRFDLIIGSDLLYERDLPALLAAFIEQHAEPCCEVVIVDPNRGNRPEFSRHMRALGYGLSERKVTVLPGLAQEAYKGRILSYSRERGSS